MAQQTDMYNLPPEVLTTLFDYLDTESLATITECSRKFNDIVSNSERLTKKFTLYLRYPQDLNSFADTMLDSDRRYRNLHIIKSRDRFGELSNPIMTHRLFPRLGEMIRTLRVDWSNNMGSRDTSLFEIVNRRRIENREGGHMDLHIEHTIATQTVANAREDIYNEFFHFIRYFANIQTLSLYNVHLERARQANEQILSFPNLKELKVSHCDAFCFDLLSSCTRLTKLNVKEPFWTSRNPGIDSFETFLINQLKLKELRLENLQYPRLFQIDRTDEIIFRLEHLVLKNVFFADKDIATRFFRNQIHLRTIQFQLHNERVRGLDNLGWYNNLLKTIVMYNRHLHSIKIEKIRYKIKEYGFLSNVVNRSVKKLSYMVTAEDKSSQLFKVFVKMLPNLEEIHFKAEESEDTNSGICFNEGTVLEKVKTLEITNSSVRSLVNLYAGSLVNFSYVPGKTGEFIDDLFGGFFHRHRNIKHLIIGSRSDRSYFFVSFNLCQLIVNFLTQLESITIFNFAEVNKSVKLLCNLQKLKSLTLSEEDHQQFTAKTKVECSRNELKLIPVAIPDL